MTLCPDLRFYPPYFTQQNFQMPSGMNNYALVNAIVDIIRQNCPDVVSIDLSHNKISSLQPWKRLGNVTRQVANLSLEGNELHVSTRRRMHVGGLLLSADPSLCHKSRASRSWNTCAR